MKIPEKELQRLNDTFRWNSELFNAHDDYGAPVPLEIVTMTPTNFVILREMGDNKVHPIIAIGKSESDALPIYPFLLPIYGKPLEKLVKIIETAISIFPNLVHKAEIDALSTKVKNYFLKENPHLSSVTEESDILSFIYKVENRTGSFQIKFGINLVNNPLWEDMFFLVLEVAIYTIEDGKDTAPLLYAFHVANLLLLLTRLKYFVLTDI